MIRPNPLFEQEVNNDPEVRAKLYAAAGEGVQAVRLASGGFRNTGHFMRSLSVQWRNGKPAVHSTDSFAHLIEYGSSKNPPYAPFRRGLRAAGFRVEEGTPGIGD